MSGYIVGIDIGGTSTKLGVWLDGERTGWRDGLELPDSTDPLVVVERDLGDKVIAFAAEVGFNQADAIGVGSCGVIVQCVQENAVGQFFKLTAEQSQWTMAGEAAPQDHHSIAVQTFRDVDGSTNEIDQLVGKVVAVLINDGDVVDVMILQKMADAVGRGMEFAAVFR